MYNYEVTKLSNKQNYQILKYFSLITYVGVLMAVCILIGYYLGTFLQNITGSFVLFVISIFLGIAAGFLAVFKLIIKL